MLWSYCSNKVTPEEKHAAFAEVQGKTAFANHNYYTKYFGKCSQNEAN